MRAQQRGGSDLRGGYAIHVRAPRAAGNGRVEVQRVLHVARGMVGRHVECFEIVIVVFDFGAFEDLVAHARENILDLLTDAHERMHASDGDLPAGERDVDGAGGWTRGIDRGARVAYRGLDIGLERVDEPAEFPALFGGNGPEALEQRRHQAVASAQKVVVQRLEIAVGGGGGEPRAELRAQRLYVGAVDGFRHSPGREARPWPAPPPERTRRTR